MATLQFKGKSAVWNHHLSVPYHTLEKDAKKSLKGAGAEENLIIEGDNLLALKSLLPKYQGRIKCIYIDPPYNIGYENWVYNDNVNSPTIRDWIGKAVGKDDLTRHDKWLCMMTPRLKLLRELLADNGVIFVSIDDSEAARLKSLMDEVFGEDRFISALVWTTKRAARGVPPTTMLMDNHEYILCYAKTINLIKFEGVPRDESDFSNPDNDPRGLWRSESIRATGGQNNVFVITDPKTGRKFKGNWAFSKERIEGMIKEKLILFPEDEDGTPRQKKFMSSYLHENKAIVSYLGWFSTENSTKYLMDIFNGKKFFDFPKPVELIKFLIQQTTSENDIVLDSFAGSGTTADAVMRQSKEDSKTRKYILVQLPEEVRKDTPAYKAGFRWIHEIMLERVKRVIAKNKYQAGFTYHTLGSAIDAESILTGKLPTYKEFAKYVFYLATGKNHPDEKKINEENWFVGKTDHQSVYLIYEKNADALKKLAITLDWAQKINAKDKDKKIVYAPACYLDDEALEQFNIQFVSIPYNLFERTK
jgi:adenine-specific DNA-methyltransferase